ncbi:ecto-ADP-ribosyltransferase 4 [Cheilinus undulatus]|uniref:ecto-ADP-ribosyltransferase 4 n=1 Tax=Cheilinus undulatus TaxID=241271 RepID=UPI001BD4B7D9|nr:ecto-ADP-ribosyltransferase 4 [Cheilinus undulatus]XP_041640490.1 ecto-ADP-ribosyltransferase 4 [Cheilinus undulatus]
MWDTRKLLLAGFICIVFSPKLSAGATKVLDMTPDAVDDLYTGCREQAMKTFIDSGLLTQELDRDEGFKKAWTDNEKCSKLIHGGVKEHTTALSAIVNGDQDFRNTFNNAVKRLGVNESIYERSFHFKSLHFLLMDAIKLVRNPNTKQCRTLHLLTDKYTAQVGSKVRFGGFTIVTDSYSELQKLEDWDGQFIFNITSCFFLNLDDSVCSKDSNMVLLSPAEEFTVMNVTKVNDQVNEAEYTAIILEQPEMRSSHNCYIFSRSPAVVSAQWLMLVLVVWPLLFLS